MGIGSTMELDSIKRAMWSGGEPSVGEFENHLIDACGGFCRGGEGEGDLTGTSEFSLRRIAPIHSAFEVHSLRQSPW